MASFRPECKHFANGTCKFGSNCRDSHTVKATGVVLASSNTTTVTERVIKAAELKHVYAVMTRTVTTTTTVLAAGGGGGLGLAALVSGGPGARGGGALYGGGGLGSGGGGALLGGGGGKAAPKVYDLDRDDVAVCAHFLKGTCKYGAKCDKPHVKPAAKPAPASGAKKRVVPCKRGAVCPFLKAGTCTFKH